MSFDFHYSLMRNGLQTQKVDSPTARYALRICSSSWCFMNIDEKKRNVLLDLLLIDVRFVWPQYLVHASFESNEG